MSPIPAWLGDLLHVEPPFDEGASVDVEGTRLHLRDGILRVEGQATETQAQTSDAFGFKWHQRDTFESQAARTRMRTWLIERYGTIAEAPWWDEYGSCPLLLDAGCGAALSAIELFGDRLRDVRYLGTDISSAVDVAQTRMTDIGVDAGFLQVDLMHLPLADESVDVIFSEGVLHHTDSTEKALHALARHLRPGGRILFYVYRRKGPIREFTDDYVRDKLQAMSPAEAWDAMLPLTKLGQVLGRLEIEVDIPEDVELLDIPAGRIDLQRFFYWHVFKAFYRADHTVEELNHINYDWFAPANAHRQTPDEVRAWCEASGLEVEREHVELAGITVIARKRVT